jgi:fructuronate reductase
VGNHDEQALEIAFRRTGNLCALVTLRPDGAVEKTVIASVAEALYLGRQEDWTRLIRAFQSPSLKIASFTITEKGYNPPEGEEDTLGRVALLMVERYRSGALPVALVSMDNCARNGDRLHQALAAHAAARGLNEPGFLDYLADRSKVGFPVTMVDKITPRPGEDVARLLAADGLTDMAPVKTARGSLAAPFVNCEAAQYLVIEDWFPNGRPPIESMPGVTFAAREAVTAAERMKVSALLNPLHTALAVFGCLLGHQRISDEMRDPLMVRLVETLGYREGLPTVSPGAIDPKAFLNTLLRERLPNPLVPDAPQRIAADTSQKMAVRFGETIRTYCEKPGLSANRLVAVPLAVAGWLRYLVAVDDAGNPFQPSPDPMLSELQAALSGIQLGDSGPFTEALKPILSNAAIFGLDLYEAGLGAQIEAYFSEMLAGPGAVRAALERRLPNKSFQ